MVTTALSSAGHTITPIQPPPPSAALKIASALLNSDGCRTFLSFFRTGERNDPGAARMSFYMSLPRPLKYLHYLYTKYIRRDAYWADLLYEFRERSAYEQWKLVARREAYKAEWHAWWQDEANKFDFIVTPPNATPAVPHGGMKDAVSSCGYTFLFNLLDYSCGVVPVTKVDRRKDALPEGFSMRGMNGVAKGAYKHYDAEAMHGLPVGVQVVGQRLQEEKVLAAMERVEECLEASEWGKYELLAIE